MYARTPCRVNIQIDMVTIRRKHTDELDLQQLRVLDALFRERSLTKAAAALNTNQPTISKHLSRVRRYFDDPLFIRVNLRMEPTSKALEIESHVRHLLDTMEVLRRRHVPFDAKTSERTFKFFTLDAGVIVFVPRMVKKILNAAPNVRMRVVQADPQHAHSLLEDGQLDLVIGAFPLLVKGIRKQRLFSTSYTALARKGHPRLGASPSIQEFVREQHVGLSAVGGGHAHQTIEQALEAILPARNIIVRVGGFASAAVVAKDMDAITSLPTPVAKVLARLLDMQLIRIPAPMPSYEVSQYWHERFDRDPGNQWLRVQVFGEFGGTRLTDRR
jgi:DNA-binding transcriptional LysR family regulator